MRMRCCAPTSGIASGFRWWRRFHGGALLARTKRRRHLRPGAGDAGERKARREAPKIGRREALAQAIKARWMLAIGHYGLAPALGNRPRPTMCRSCGLIPCSLLYLSGLEAGARQRSLIAQLEADPAMAKTHHRKTWPFKPGWEKEVHVWPFLLRIEFLAAIIVTIILMVWSITLNAPLEEPANPNLTMNPAKAPWYFLGLQEMLVYFDPWIAGVVMPTLIIVGLMVIPYIDTNPLGNGYYTWKQRKFAICTFLFGFIVLWIAMIIIGTFIRGPGWKWFWPGKPGITTA